MPWALKTLSIAGSFAELHTLESQGIIQPVTELTEWCAPIVVAPKRDCDNVRICIDFSKLNKFVKREFYSSGTPMDAIADISGEHSKIFPVFDALKGYHQCPLDEQRSTAHYIYDAVWSL